MSDENCKNVSNCKQSFKAVENFLRRVAFNIGNTQSRTEVKIISCIPIDVTDLQQRIYQLQNELADVKAKETLKPCITCAKRAAISPKQVLCNECLVSTTSDLSLFCPGCSSSTQVRRSGSVDRMDQLTKTQETDKNKSFFAKKKKEYKNKLKSRLVYCAQPDINTPFSNHVRVMNDHIKTKSGHKGEKLNRSYLAEVVKKQYQQTSFANEFTNFSDISSPDCTDRIAPCSPNSPYFESDIFSCYRGQFQNIDKYMNNRNNANKYSTSEAVGTCNGNEYYDSKFYDIIPVKEKKRKDIDKQKGCEPKKHIIKCWPERARPKLKAVSPTLVNYCTVSPLPDECVRRRTLPNDKRVVRNRWATTGFKASTPRRLAEVDLGPIYAKKVKGHKNVDIMNTITTQRRNVGTGLPTGDKVAGCQTAASAATITDPPEDKTETTLNQIKNMLQSVLTEVKINSSVGNPPVPPKRDAVVQNEPTRSYEYGASQLLQSYTYSPYNMNVNPYIPSCSHPIPSGNYGYPEYSGAQGMPFQQYPLLIQQPKHLCSSYYRNRHFCKPVTKHAASTATNTEQGQERSKETEQLIKEIYKSMALNMEASSKDNSFREYTKPKATANYHDVVKMENDKESRSIAQVISEIFRNTRPRDSTATGTTDTTLNSYVNPNKDKVVSENSVKKDYKTQRKEHYTQSRRDQETERMSTHHEANEPSDSSEDTVAEDTEESSTEIETAGTEETKQPIKTTEAKKEKNGIFKKMLKIFQPKRRRRRRDNVVDESEKETDSDSDDYQTVYSHNVADATPKPKKVQAMKSRPHSKVFYSKQPQKRKSTRSPEKHGRTSPYMEQEYRRYWDENLIFHENQHHGYSTRASRLTPDRDQRSRPYYYRNYETRQVHVDPIRQVPLRMPGNYVKAMRAASKSRYTGQSEHCAGNQPNNPGHSYQSNPNKARNNVSTGTAAPHFVTVKGNANRKGAFAKGWLKKCKPECAQQWKELIMNG